MLSFDLVPIDAASAALLSGRLAERGHHVRLRSAEPLAEASGASAPLGDPDLVLVVTAQRSVGRDDAAALLALALGADQATTGAPLALSTTLDLQPDAIAALYEAGFDLVLGAGAQRDLELHLEGFLSALQRATGTLERPRVARLQSPMHDPALVAAFSKDQAARRRAAARWWSLGSLEPGALRTAVAELARQRSHVFLRGESGAGRRHVARTLHEAKTRKGGFVQVGAERLDIGLPELEARLVSLLKLARGGTLCLTDLVSLRPDRARVLAQSVARAKHTRLIVTAAPGARPPGVPELTFVCLDVPALRDRPEVIPNLVERLIDAPCDHRALAALQAHRWPGNIPELEAVLKRAEQRAERGAEGDTQAGAEGGTVHLHHLPKAFVSYLNDRAEPTARPIRRRAQSEPAWRITDDDPISIETYERKLYLRALAQSNGSCLEAAALLGVGKSTIYRKLGQHGLRAAATAGQGPEAPPPAQARQQGE